jgi:tetratricopeptide (TPR) repeat protein
VNLANLLRDQRRFDEAIDHYREAALHSPPGDLRALRGLAETGLQRDGNHSAAIATLEEAARRDPRSAEARLLLGHFLRLDGQLERAIEAYRLALALDPENPALRRNLDDALAARAQP